VTNDGQSAYVTVLDGGTFQIHRITLTGPEAWTPVVTGERCCTLQDMNRKHLLFAVSTINAPWELYIANLDGSHEHQLTRINAGLLAQRALPAVEHLLFPGKDETQVEGWILKPALGRPPYPTILYIHGGRQAANGHVFGFDHQMLAGAGYAVLLVNYRGSVGYGDEFALSAVRDWGNHDYGDLMAGVDFAIEGGLADPDRLGCCGVSAGGTLSCWIVGQTDRFKAAVPENPITNWASAYGTSDIGHWFHVQEFGGPLHETLGLALRNSAIIYAHRCKTPTLLVHHEQDYRCPSDQAEQFYAVLKASGCIVEMVRFPGSSHGGAARGEPQVRRVQNEVLLDWMNRYVLGLVPSEEVSG
jgi:dipeptidyl aminopeptidase/acylaminoacyl peptidase